MKHTNTKKMKIISSTMGIIIMLFACAISTMAETTPPLVEFISQNPEDITSSNTMSVGLNITYNITDDTEVDDSTVTIYYKTNSTTSDCWGFINGTESWCGYNKRQYSEKTSTNYEFELHDNNIYPATYNFDPWPLESTPHIAHNLGGSNNYLKIRMFNVSNTKQYSFFEIMARNQSATSGPMNMYYCNQTYTNGPPVNNPSCTHFYTITAETPYDHSHGQYSYHLLIPFAINTTNNQIGTVQVTPTSYFIVRGMTGSSWNIYYINNISRADTIQTTTNSGNSWTNFAGTVDAHLHQFEGSDTFYYYVCANDTSDNENCTTPRSDVMDLTPLPPSPPSIYAPTEGYYKDMISINYTPAISPNNYLIVKYNISILYTNETFVQTLISNNHPNLNYTFDSKEFDDENYIILIQACDDTQQCSSGYSENFTIDNTAPTTTLQSPADTYQTTTATTKNITLNCSATDNTQLANISLHITNSTNESFSMNSTTATSGTSSWINWTLELAVGNYTWNCIAYDIAGNYDWADANRTISVNYSEFTPLVAFSITLPGQLPINATEESSSTASMNFSAITASINGVEPCVGDSTDCQNSTLPFFEYLNTGNVNLTINLSINTNLPSEFSLKVNTVHNRNTATTVTSSMSTLNTDITPGSTLDAFFFGDFIGAYPENSTARTLTSHGSQSTGG